MEKYFNGTELYGDDFSEDEIKEWFKDEEEGYADLINVTKDSYDYQYHGVNILHGFNKLPKNMVFSSALGVGAAYGEEFQPILDRIEKITILDPSEKFKNSSIGGVPVNYVKPAFDGTLTFENNSFDLITCFGTLHHIPNVSYVIQELSRTLKPGGFFLIREPIYSMGDWRKKRPGLTIRERGIPKELLQKMLLENNLSIISKQFCFFTPSYKLQKLFKKRFDNKLLLGSDKFFSALFSNNIKYHRTSKLHKLAATAVFYVVRKN